MDVNFDGDGNLDVAADALTLKTFWSIAEVVALAGCQRSAAKSPLPSPSKFTLPTTTMAKSTVRDRSRTYDQSSDGDVDDPHTCNTAAHRFSQRTRSSASRNRPRTCRSCTPCKPTIQVFRRSGRT